MGFTDAGEIPNFSLNERLKCDGFAKPLSKAASFTFLFLVVRRYMAWFNLFSSNHFPGVE